MRTWDEPRCAVFGVKLIHHQDKADKRPPVGFALDIHMKLLSRRAWFQRPGEHRAKFEWSTDDMAARSQHGAVDIQPVEFRPSIDEIVHACRRSNRDIITI